MPSGGRNFKDLTGKKFGRLTAIERGMVSNKHRHVRWLCQCDCGNEKIIDGQSLRTGATQSCGCLNKESPNNKRRLVLGRANMRDLICIYKTGADKRGYDFTLTEEQFKKLTSSNCYYCGGKPSNIYNKKGSNGEYIYNGIDRKDNNKGYTVENSVPCCYTCNRAKGTLTLQEFKDWVKRLCNNYQVGAN